MLVINDKSFIDRAEIIWEKGTNRARFFRGEDPSYEWKDTGSSFLPSELNAAFLYAQLESIKDIQNRRIKLWNLYAQELKTLEEDGYVTIPRIPEFATNNGNSFYVLCKDRNQRDQYLSFLKGNGIMGLSHYIPLHKSQFYSKMHNRQVLEMSEFFADTMVRLPIHNYLSEKQIFDIIENTKTFFMNL
jgi:dTDP-4-amino-4,6-dideoxygalactose transaminase